MAENPRTAAQVAAALVAALVPGSVWNVMSMISRQRVEADAERVLDSWRRELLADGWTFLPGEMPETHTRRLIATRWKSGRRAVIVGYYDKPRGKWFHFGDGGVEIGGEPYAHRPLPEPPPVPEGES